MRFLVIFLIVPIVAISAAISPRDLIRFEVVLRQCEKEFTVDPTMIDRVEAGEMINDPAFDCFIACILERMNLVEADGRLNIEATIRHVPDAPLHDEIVETIRKCGTQTGRNKCDTAHRLFSCFHNHGVSL